ncbi:uncharacterized protein BXZ73DRAFT_45408 [Epithele typhae]|uniref:uncharacterized protein n=1 Tax=Epithele typhae TaxID=378194 RepID=UPI0020079B9C|nr:uncharacterized protein BXZ73DRAFT_45408 [Epithele typhae]KAH9935967.1 hypothetical protein BXZ73DRAFT_45408 [Epithele typhae]
MSGTPSSSRTYAQAPFNNPAGRDIILQSSDGTLFLVRSAILAEASPIFADMLGIPQPNANESEASDSIDGKPVVLLTEDSQTLDPLLRLCYPTRDPELTELSDIRCVLGAAIKYEMDEAAELMKDLLRSFIATEPLRTWATACLLRLEDEAKAAATSLLGREIPAEAPAEFNDVSAGDYYRLETFHRARGNVPGTFTFCEPNPTDVEQGTDKRKARRLSKEDGELAFQARPYADIICRSTDGYEFPAHRIILTMASHVLADFVAAASAAATAAAPDPKTGFLPTPVLEMDAEGSALGPLLELCYARARTSVPHLSQLTLGRTLAMAAAARRYALAGALDLLRFQAFWHAQDARPLAAYLGAARAGFADWAADVLSRLRGDLYAYGYVPEMEDTPAAVYHRLMVNRRRGAVAAEQITGTPVAVARVVSSASGASSRPASVMGIPRPAAGPQYYEVGDSWLIAMSRQLAERLAQFSSGPDGGTIYSLDPKLKSILAQSLERNIWCPKCDPNARIMLGMREMFDKFVAVMYHHNVSARSR